VIAQGGVAKSTPPFGVLLPIHVRDLTLAIALVMFDHYDTSRFPEPWVSMKAGANKAASRVR
jgi:hypothetical protein